MTRQEKLQVFVVARVGGHKPCYRSLATVLVNWLDEVSSVEICLRLIQIISAPENRECLKQELRLAGVDVTSGRWSVKPRRRRLSRDKRPVGAVRDESRDEKKKKGPEPEPELGRPFFSGSGEDECDMIEPRRAAPEELYQQLKRPCPFPFITTCLFVGSSRCNTRSGLIADILEQPYGSSFDQTRNDGALLMLDVTDLDRCKYAFVHVPWREEEDEDDPWSDLGDFDTSHQSQEAMLPKPHDTPLSGKEYLQALEKMRGCRGDTRKLVREADSALGLLSRFEVIDVDCLTSLWPFRHWKINTEQEPRGDIPLYPLLSTCCATSQCDRGLPASLARTTTNQRNTLKSLKTLALSKAVDATLATTQKLDLAIFTEVSTLPDFRECLRACLESRTRAVLVNPNVAVELLRLAFSGAKHVDLGPHCGLKIDHVRYILGDPGVAGTMDSLSIAPGTLVNSDFARLAEVLPATGIRNFYLAELPGRTGDTFDPSEAFRALRPKVREKLMLGPVFSHGIRPFAWLPDIPRQTWLHSSPSTVQYDTCLQAIPIDLSSRGYREAHVVQILCRPAAEINPAIPNVEVLYIGDAVLQPTKVVTGLLGMLRYRVLADALPEKSVESCLEAAFSFASAPGSLINSTGDRDLAYQSLEISAFPAELHAIGRSAERLMPNSYGVSRWPPMRDLRPDSWTVIVSQWRADRTRDTSNDDRPLPGSLGEPSWKKFTSFFRVAFVRPKADVILALPPKSTTPPSRASLLVSRDALETIGIEEYLQRATGSTAGLDTVLSDLQDFFRERWATRSRGGPRGLPPSEDILPPVLSAMSQEEACDIVNEAISQERRAHAVLR